MSSGEQRYNYLNITPLHSIEEDEETEFNSVGEFLIFHFHFHFYFYFYFYFYFHVHIYFILAFICVTFKL